MKQLLIYITLFLLFFIPISCSKVKPLETNSYPSFITTPVYLIYNGDSTQVGNLITTQESKIYIKTELRIYPNWANNFKVDVIFIFKSGKHQTEDGIKPYYIINNGSIIFNYRIINIGNEELKDVRIIWTYVY